MRFNEHVMGKIRQLVRLLYSQTLNDSTLLEAFPLLTTITGSPYITFVRLLASDHFAKGLQISEAPSEFIKTYSEIWKEDFIMETLVRTQKTLTLQSIPGWDSRNRRGFLEPLNRIRPSTDVIYVPSKIGGILVGCWAVATEGAKKPPYDSESIRVFEFLSSFLTEALRRALHTVSAPEDVALLDTSGNVLFEGNRIAESFTVLFGLASREQPCRSTLPAGDAFRKRFYSFVWGTPNPWNSCFIWEDETGSKHEFVFRIHKSGDQYLQSHNKLVVSVVRVAKERDRDETILPVGLLQKHFGFTKEEIEVVHGAYQGLSNLEIGLRLGISEPSVKRRLGMVYEKTGTSSRMQLLFRLTNLSEAR